MVHIKIESCLLTPLSLDEEVKRCSRVGIFPELVGALGGCEIPSFAHGILAIKGIPLDGDTKRRGIGSGYNGQKSGRSLHGRGLVCGVSS